MDSKVQTKSAPTLVGCVPQNHRSVKSSDPGRLCACSFPELCFEDIGQKDSQNAFRPGKPNQKMADSRVDSRRWGIFMNYSGCFPWKNEENSQKPVPFHENTSFFCVNSPCFSKENTPNSPKYPIFANRLANRPIFGLS